MDKHVVMNGAGTIKGIYTRAGQYFELNIKDQMVGERDGIYYLASETDRSWIEDDTRMIVIAVDSIEVMETTREILDQA